MSGKRSHDAQRFAGIFELEQPGALRGLIRLMENEHELAVEAAENHPVTAIIRKERSGLLAPRAMESARVRDRDAGRVAGGAAAGPDHKELSRLGSIEIRTVGHPAAILV